ncbi:response regulator [Wohlfahrtiimonas chitiniclastica]|uniref:Protein pilG n=1 Tax=Wohlfahrtiimonas chitiniclastica SH04 TaxID=1261130 RepID=L8XY73_9GAMM|nr:response regulator [Wohlfahrtiimonas chitiniclastica]ELV07266.1 Protein pilG [Wohlfahrtiimonas chitiniclastica SH04]KZS23523.1 protein pilG [Wohlfahrtiimonas chitiniclastica]KZX36292.1 protein pilG [Wohlfahrtiimonas chitiniclastica]KZX36729.1 protein pilG [Wohlfahrtiimonas chitiniclastica]MBS7816929.1 response regulator [Wohlfahrtiimonas chitiniclastica]
MNKTALIIDDSATARIGIKNMLQNLGYTAHTANNGLDALERVLSVQPDVILLDLSMPVLEGTDVLSLLKQHSTTQKIPVIILSGKEGICDRMRAQTLGAVGFLGKPCKAELLTDLLTSLNLTA